MRILITAGGTTEPIDQVRGITNHSSGRLGSLLALNFFNDGHEVDYITTKGAIQLPQKHNLHTYTIQTTQDLEETLTQLMTQNKYDAVIHSMAVSDYRTKQVFKHDDFIDQLARSIESRGDAPLRMILSEAIQEAKGISSEAKISSDVDSMMITLEKTPKVIQKIKQLQPDTILVGFKLLVDVGFEELLEVGHANLKKNNADFVLANDLSNINGDKHVGLFIYPDGSYKMAATKQAIARLISKTIEEKVRKGI
ncbi:MAG: phosphopantothenate--cysteine ligase [Streptococcaceae bacterium]|jgi:phosphopantothenate-cysteine ligase|nr:phosphopantothenate--cysteine ligase [Streptococcaceae bacterium]